MPRRLVYQPESLRQTSLLNIACHFESFWCAANTFTVMDYPNLSNCIATFEYLSDDILQSLLEILAQKKLLQIHHFQHILGSNIRNLNLRLPGKVADHFSVLRTVGVRCQKLTHLNISGLSTIKAEVLRDLVTHLPQLVSLNLNYTRTNSKVLKAVALNCPNLLELYILGCQSERGADFDIQEFVSLSQNLGHPRLRTIRFYSSDVSVNTKVALLNAQQSLQILGDSKQIDRAFEEMYGDQFQSTKVESREWICHLLELQIIGFFGTSGTLRENLRLELAIRCCPFLTDLRLSYLTDHTSLGCVSKLKHLKVFHVVGTTTLPISFKLHLLPILTTVGTSLISLMFYNITQISVTTIGTLCPNLESLNLRLVNYTPEPCLVPDNSVTCFKMLTELELRDSSNPNLAISEKEVFCYLVHATELINISISVSNITDDVISKVNETHGFRYLQKAKFYNCKSISLKTGLVFMSYDNPLRELSFYECENMTGGDRDRLIEVAKSLKFNVRIDWRPFGVY